jgi:shikimate dehydrogenase
MSHTGQTTLAGVLGWPVTHSLSPRLHGYWLEQHGIDAAYLPLPVHPDHLPAAIRGLAALGFRGANVTVPHKQAVLPLCDQIAPSARRAGAVNTLSFDPAHGITGSNTDGAGFLAALHDHGVHPTAAPALIIGAGGAARAIATALLDHGCTVTVTSRRDPQAHHLAAQIPGLAVLPWPAWPQLGAFGLLINATAGGMTGQPPLTFDLRPAPPSLVVADIVYAPRHTDLLTQAAAQGLATVEGIDMLLHQAAASFSQWFGLTPIVDAKLRDFVLAPPPCA